jgi:uncharacterized protein (TIGR00369 family)
MSEFRENIVEMVNAHRGGYDTAMGLTFVSVAPDELVAELTVGAQHTQPYGLVHGGVYAGAIEALCSTGAALDVMGDGRSAVGLENCTSFLRAARAGKLRGVARPLHRGRTTQVWIADVFDEQGQLLATGRVRLQVLERGSAAGGKVVALAEPDGRAR